MIFARFGGPPRVFGIYVQTIGTLQHTFEASITKKEATFEEAFNLKTGVMHLNNELCQAQMQVQRDALTIQALELAKSNFIGMQSQLWCCLKVKFVIVDFSPFCEVWIWPMMCNGHFWIKKTMNFPFIHFKQGLNFVHFQNFTFIL